MKEYTFNNNVKMATCAGCGYETPFWNIIDHWILVNGKEYCRKCQKLNMEKYAEPKWTSVSELLPEHENNVLAVLDGQVRIMRYFTIINIGEYSTAWAMVYDALDGDAHLDDEYEPTHWMEIPKPPKKII